MAILSEIGQPTFIEIIRVDPVNSTTCESKAVLGNSRWQNPYNRFDVNGDGVIDNADYNVLLQWIGRNGQGQLPGIKPDTDPWVDVNGDGAVDDKDLQQLSDYLAGRRDESDPTCHRVSDFKIERDLFDPGKIINCTTNPTVRSAACHKNILPTANYTPYFYVFTGILEATWDATIKTKDSIIYVHNDLLVLRDNYFAGCSNTPRVLNRILKRLQVKIFPYRYDPRNPSPKWPSDTSNWRPGDAGKVLSIPDEPILSSEPDATITTTTTTAEEPMLGLLQKVVIINIFSDAKQYLTTAEWYSKSSSRVSNGPVYGNIPWNNGFQASGSHYIDDRTLWNQFIDSIEDNDSINVRVGLVHPKGIGNVWPIGNDLPKDSYGDMVEYISFEQKSPRISTNNIINAFNILTQNGQLAPTLLIFVVDSADGSMWSQQISNATTQLKNEYPRMDVIKYPFNKSFSRWIMMDMDAMFQLVYQRDNVNNPNISSSYRTDGIEGIIENPVTFQQLRQDHIETRLVNNQANVNWFEMEFDRESNGYALTEQSKGKTNACYAILNPFGWSVNSQISGTGGMTSRPQRTQVSFTSNPYFIFQHDSFENGFWSLNYIWTDDIVVSTISVVDINPNNAISPRIHVAYAHSKTIVNTTPWLSGYLSGMQLDIRIDSYLSSNLSDTNNTVINRAIGIDECDSQFCPRWNADIKYQFPSNVANVFNVTHLDPYYGAAASPQGGYYVSIWYDDLHAIVTEGSIQGPRTKDHFVALLSGGSMLEERQRSIAIYSDPDFQDKIYDAVKHFFEINSRFVSLQGQQNTAFNIKGWIAYNRIRVTVNAKYPWEILQGCGPVPDSGCIQPPSNDSGFPLVDPTSFVMKCPQYPVGIQ